MSYGPKDRNFRGAEPPMTAVAILEEWRPQVQRAVRSDPRTAKQIAQDAGGLISPRQIENIREGETGTSLPTFFILAEQIPELKALAYRWLNAAQNCDPEHERLANDMILGALRIVRRRQSMLEQQIREGDDE